MYNILYLNFPKKHAKMQILALFANVSHHVELLKEHSGANLLENPAKLKFCNTTKRIERGWMV